MKLKDVIGDNSGPRYAHILGWGQYIPSKVLTNDDLAQMIDTSDEWIIERTGIRERHIVADGETTATMSIKAAQDALRVADFAPDDVDLIIVATATPDYMFPSTACLVQDALGATHAAAFDLSAGCSGFVYGLAMATHSIRSGAYNSALIIGSETLSRVTDWEDRNTCVLFGDGAGAVLLIGSDVEGGVLSTVLGSDGSGGEVLVIPGGGSRHPASQDTVLNRMHYIRMNGREVFRFAARILPRASREACEEAGLSTDDIDLFIPHQANKRIIQFAAKSLKVPEERIFMNLDRCGNTSAASIPLALVEAISRGFVKPNDTLVLVGFGAGLTWGAAAVRWGVSLPVEAPPRWRRAWHWLYYRWAALRSGVLRLTRRVESMFKLPFEREQRRPEKEKEPPKSAKTEKPPTEPQPAEARPGATESPPEDDSSAQQEGN
jgi:3-oxoacyl-[acyl-carrier-protein] synthase-3